MNIMEQFGYPSTETAKTGLLEQVRTAGAVRLEAGYSGGNDEGGVNDIKLFDAEGGELPVPETWITRAPKPDDQPWSIRDGKVHEYHPLWEAADAMLSTEFGSWAGDFTAYGTLHADVSTGKVHRSGEQSSYNEDGNEY